VRDTLRIPVIHISDVAEARRAAVTLAQSVGFDETRAGQVALVATELARNLAVHADRSQQLLLRPLQSGEAAGIELLALDKGPGIADLGQAFHDGFSTGGTPGTGLGAVSRLSTFWAVDSQPGLGTALLSQLWTNLPTEGRPPGPLELGAVSLPLATETRNGDGWHVLQRPQLPSLLVVDGLGHGPEASEAAVAAIRAFHDLSPRPPAQALEGIHEALRKTRGAAVAVAEFDLDARLVRYAGAGNIVGVILGAEESHAMVSHNGTVGGEVRRFQEFTYPWPPGALVVLHSDGISRRWDLSDYPGLATKPPGLIAGVLYRDFARDRDDATVVVARASAEAVR
jgi:anti-sigma regulatory factor (Ser/Thr protein kinase)